MASNAPTDGKTKPVKGINGKALDGSHCCFHCGTANAERRCSGCYLARYCGSACQKKHWKHHKPACQAVAKAAKRRKVWAAAASIARKGDSGESGHQSQESGASCGTCVICIGPMVAPVELPCGHAYCSACISEVRAKEVAQTCPLCREELPEGLEGLYDLAYFSKLKIWRMAARNEVDFACLPPAVQTEMDEAVVVLNECAVQGHLMAQIDLGNLYSVGVGVEQDDARPLSSSRTPRYTLGNRLSPKVWV
mmetsp:Transcript_44645/g.121665  ORF Transcript_44645/g.121665 Transcript_44645/m.121665 type:complete len:251 (-) Transcript_44645:400-1152(-)